MHDFRLALIRAIITLAARRTHTHTHVHSRAYTIILAARGAKSAGRESRTKEETARLCVGETRGREGGKTSRICRIHEVCAAAAAAAISYAGHVERVLGERAFIRHTSHTKGAIEIRIRPKHITYDHSPGGTIDARIYRLRAQRVLG